MDPVRKARQVDRLLAYVLGRRPSEFGLVPDSDGYVRIRELIKALREETEERHLRPADLDSVFWALERPAVERTEKRIRAVDRSRLPKPQAVARPPALLYTAVRRRAWPVIRTRDLRPAGQPWVVLAADREMAVRIGRRSDPEPVVLTVHTAMALSENVTFMDPGPPLYCAATLPAGCLSGPAPPKERREDPRSSRPEPPKRSPEPGSFRIDPFAPRPSPRLKKKRRDPAWKRERRRGKLSK